MEQLWAQISGVQPAPPRAVVALLGALALGLVAWRPSWRVLRQVVTIAHEGAHALAALASGRSLHGVRLHRDTSGLTVTRGLARGPGVVATLAAGYPGPALLGLAGAWLLGLGRAVLLLWLLLVVLAALLLQIRNWFGLVAVLLSGGVLVLVTRYLPGEGQTAFAYALVWFLLLAAPYAVVDLVRARRHGAAHDSDADQLASLTPLPAGVWVAVFLLVTLGCLLGGAALMLGRLW